MKKIGIITMFYKNYNYGGILQAYALCEFLNKNGYDAEQIRFLPYTSAKENCFNIAKRVLSLGLDYALISMFNKFKKRFRRKNSVLLFDENDVNLYEKEKADRKKFFDIFINSFIPNSKEIYFTDTIESACLLYDIFITGSDQVWNFRNYCPIYFLGFVPENKVKLSYAASFSMDKLLFWQKRVLKKHLVDFKGISFREECDSKILESAKSKTAEFVLDPTLLLEKKDWDNICEGRIINEKYVFCYFLGENAQERNIAERFAKNKGLKLVTIPHAGGGIRKQDFGFGDIQFGSASPSQFISLIKYADYVFTDSFHAIVFSHIYEKQYFIFNRNSKKNMTSRIKNITSLFSTEEHYCYCDEVENIEYVESLKLIDYNSENTRVEELKEKSKKFLFEYLGV